MLDRQSARGIGKGAEHVATLEASDLQTERLLPES